MCVFEAGLRKAFADFLSRYFKQGQHESKLAHGKVFQKRRFKTAFSIGFPQDYSASECAVSTIR
ncbi:MAG: hypothetical protein DCO97_16040 [Marivita sp. XM-24bin2]|jgi:hypothetical protein|nr:MAG: hypothetical protein DCO97_16040 [Marivita sp. XM-24bin2]